MSARIVAMDKLTEEEIPAEESAAARFFKLRFAAPREPGRSALSAVRPLALPAPLTDKFYARGGCDCAGEAAVERALVRVRERFALGPRDKYPHPVTTSHEYGWHGAGAAGAAAAAPGTLRPHHIRDSAWLRVRLRLLAPDAAFKRQ